MMDKVMFDKCKRASFIKLPGDDWSRVDGFDPEEKKELLEEYLHLLLEY